MISINGFGSKTFFKEKHAHGPVFENSPDASAPGCLFVCVGTCGCGDQG